MEAPALEEHRSTRGAVAHTPDSKWTRATQPERPRRRRPYADTISADHQSISRGAEYSRGAEDDALFEPGRLGLTPRLGFDVHESGFHFEPFVKSELLVTTQGVPDTIIVEFVAGGRIAYTLASWLDVGARAWGVFTVAGTTTHSLDVGVVEPELRLSYKAFHSTAGALLPFAGDLTCPTSWARAPLSPSRFSRMNQGEQDQRDTVPPSSPPSGPGSQRHDSDTTHVPDKSWRPSSTFTRHPSG